LLGSLGSGMKRSLYSRRPALQEFELCKNDVTDWAA